MRSLRPDVFDKNRVSTLPLDLDRVNGGCPVTSLFLGRLPIELFHHITPYLAPADLVCLSLVDTDCLHLARSVQYASIRFDHSKISVELLNELEHSNTRLSNIGLCVRRVTVSENHGPANSRPRVPFESLNAQFQHEQCVSIFGARTVQLSYLGRLSRVIQSALPNLHVLDWDYCGTMTRDILACIAASSIKHLRLNGIQVDKEFTIPLQSGQPNWDLETLVINVSWEPSHNSFGTPASLIGSMLFQASRTLRRLVWKGDRHTFHNHGVLFPSSREMFSFQNLRSLVLDSVYADTSVLSVFLGESSKLRPLSVDLAMPTDLGFLGSCGYIPTLHSFHWINNSTTSGYDEIMSFVRSNLQLQCFGIVRPLPSNLLNLCLLSTICTHLDNLTSLRLVWEEESVPRESLRAIGTIRSLEHLWISAGAQTGLLHEWEVDHNIVLEELASLLFLESISFSRDSYRSDTHPLKDPSVQGYFTVKALPAAAQPLDYLTEAEIQLFNRAVPDFHAALAQRNEMVEFAWEKWHQSQMIKIGTRYAEEFLCLKWCFIGQLEMMIIDCGTSKRRAATLLIESRDSSCNSVKEKWGLPYSQI